MPTIYADNYEEITGKKREEAAVETKVETKVVAADDERVLTK